MPTVLPNHAVTTAPASPLVIRLPALTAGASLTAYGEPASGSLVLNPDQSLTYTPAAGFLGSDEFAYSLRLGSGADATGRVLIVVARPNVAPAPVDDEATTAAGTPIVITALANDADPDGDTLRLSTIAMPAHGTVTVEPDQGLRYAPQTGFAGADSFSYAVSDGRGGTSSAVVSVTVQRAEGAPVANDDAAVAQVGTPVTIAVLANDTDPEGDPLTLAAVGLPARGTLTVNPDQTVTYLPNAGFVGADEFTYQASDGRGGTDSARVAVEVRRPNRPPVARNDSATTPVDAPVTVAVLGNDTDPDGDQLSLVALGLPQQGTLAVNADRSVTYTPQPGTSGADEFRYTVSDGWGGTASARVAVTVGTPAQPPRLFPNGYAFRRRLAVPAALVEGEHAGFPLWVRLSGAYLRPTSASGRLAGGAHLDARFELEDGTKLPHDVDLYDAAAGVLAAWVRLPALSQQGNARLVFYYAKPGLAAAETDPAGVWADYLAVWHLPADADRGPAGRGLARAGTVTDDAAAAGGLAGAVALAGAGVLRRDDAGSWLGGLGGLTVQLRARAAALGSARGVLNCGAFGTDEASGLTLRHDGAGGAIFAKLRTTAGDVSLRTRPGAQTTAWQSLALGWAAGDARLGLTLDGRAAEAAEAAEIANPASATTAIADALVIGAGARDTAAGGWQGNIDEVRVRARKLPRGWLAAEHANQTAPDRFYGVGAEDSADDLTQSPVALPIRVATRVNSWVDIDVLAGAVSLPGPNPTVLTAIGQPGNGIASVIAGKIRYTPTIGYLGPDTFTYTLGAGAKRTTSRITVAVEGQDAGLPVPRNTRPVTNPEQLRQALGAAQAGDHIILADGSYEGNFTAARAGTAADPVVIRAATPLGARVRGSIRLTGADVWIWGLRLEGATVEIAADRARMSRCEQTDTTGIALFVSRGKDVEIDHNLLSGMRDRGISVRADPARPDAVQGTHIHHNHIRDFRGEQGTNVHEGLQLGLTKTHTDVALRALVEWNLFENVSIDSECVSIKSSENTVQFNTLLNCRAHLTNRHGGGNQILANWIENSLGMRLQDSGGRAVGNRLINCANGLQTMAGNVTPAGWPDNGTHPASEGWLLAGNNADRCTIGFAFDGSYNLPSRDTRVEGHTGPVTLGARQTGTVQSPTTAEPVPSARRLTAAEVGPASAA